MGLIGIAINLSFIVILLLQFRKRLSDSVVKFSYNFILTMLVLSLFEINVFSTIYSDFLFFTIAGIGINKVKEKPIKGSE